MRKIFNAIHLYNFKRAQTYKINIARGTTDSVVNRPMLLSHICMSCSCNQLMQASLVVVKENTHPKLIAKVISVIAFWISSITYSATQCHLTPRQSIQYPIICGSIRQTPFLSKGFKRQSSCYLCFPLPPFRQTNKQNFDSRFYSFLAQHVSTVRP